MEEPGAGINVEVDVAGVTVTCQRQVGLIIECHTSLVHVADRDAERIAAELVELVTALADDVEAAIRDVISR